MTTVFMTTYIALWILVALVIVAVAALAKQIGLLHKRIEPVGARIMNVGPSVGETISPFSGTGIRGNPVHIPSSDGRSTAIIFVSSSCPVCEELAPALISLAEHEKTDLRLVLVSFNGDEAKTRSYAAKHGLENVECIFSPELAHTFSVLMAPYAIIIDRLGVVRNKGLVNNREHLESLLNAVDDGHESIQAFHFAQRSANTTSDPKTSARLTEEAS
jgi:methylamine dehydrogenase accessory protein MauD